MLVVRRSDQESVCVMCVSCLAICRTEGDRETSGWFLSQRSSGDWRDFLFWTSPTQSTPPTISAVIYLRTWPSAYPNPLPLLFSPFAVSLPPTPSLFSPSITPSYHHLSVCIPDSSTVLLFFCSLFPWFHLFPSPLLPLSSLILFFFEPVYPHPKGERSMGLINMERPEQISLSICRRIPCSAPLIVSRKQSVY